MDELTFNGSKYVNLIFVTGFAFLILAVIPIASAETVVVVRGQVTNVGVPEFTWDNSSFAGFYYDMDRNLGAETITFRLSDAVPTGATLSDQQDPTTGYRGVVYRTQAQPKNFKFKAWGQYEVIGFLADRYFAAYDSTATQDVVDSGAYTAYLFDQSKNRNLMTNEQISQVLMDDNKEITITAKNPLKLAEGYELGLKFVNGTQAVIELKNNNSTIDTKIIQPSAAGATMSDKTYCYRTSIGDTSDIIQIAVHFKNCIHSLSMDLATVDGEFQISDTPTGLKSDQQYDKMSIKNVDPTNMMITMDNKDKQITLSKNKDVVLMQNVHIKTADQDGTADQPLRYYIYKAITAPGTYQLRGTVANLGLNEVTWYNSTFSGFYYDIDKNLGAETITFRPTSATPTSATLSDQPIYNAGNRGVVYNTHAQPKKFKYKPWGQYDVIGFLANRFFAAYDSTVTADVAYAGAGIPYLYDQSKNRNLMTNEQISPILIDDNKEIIISTKNSLRLAEGYELGLKFVNGTQAVVELRKNNSTIDTKIIQPSIAGATMGDQTYYYKASIGDTSEIVQIAVHFKNCIHGPGTDLATVDGEFQISDTPTPLKADQQYDKMSIRNVDATNMMITMDNKDNQITLSKNKDILLMNNIHIKTANQDGTADTPLRYYIYSEVNSELG